MNSEGGASDEGGVTPEYLKHWPGLYTRAGDDILEALPEDVAVVKGYPAATHKGEVVGGKRLTILTRKSRYQVDEEVRVLHVMEVVEPGHKLFVMGPKAIYGEYVDDRPVTQEEAPSQIYDGLVLDSPDVDYNYDITSYRFSEPGRHRISWRLGNLRSNTLELQIVSE